MKHTMDYIKNKPSDFKICSYCGYVNWYENKDCIMCGFSNFYHKEEAVKKWVDVEIKFRKELGIIEDEILNTEIDT